MSSVPSSMMVRSAPKSVSNTLSKPRRRSAAAILPVTLVPMGRPNSSPKAARTATYRVAADVVCTVYCGTEELTRATLPLFEFGRDVELALPSKK